MDDIDQPTAAEAAFRHEGEQARHAYSFLRETAAEALGLRYGSLTEDDVIRHPNPDYQLRVRLEKELRELESKKGRPKNYRLKAEEIKSADALIAEIKKLADEQPETMTWKGMKRDAAIVVWLCSQPDHVCKAARTKPQEYESKVDEWANEHCRGEKLSKVLAEFSKIIATRNDPRGEPDFGNEKRDADPNS